MIQVRVNELLKKQKKTKYWFVKNMEGGYFPPTFNIYELIYNILNLPNLMEFLPTHLLSHMCQI